MLAEQGGSGDMALGLGKLQSRVAIAVLQLGVGAGGQQVSHARAVPHTCSNHKGG